MHYTLVSQNKSLFCRNKNSITKTSPQVRKEFNQTPPFQDYKLILPIVSSGFNKKEKHNALSKEKKCIRHS